MCTADNSGRYTHKVAAEAEGQRKRRLACSECPLCSWLATQEQKPAIVLANFGSFTTHAVSAVFYTGCGVTVTHVAWDDR